MGDPRRADAIVKWEPPQIDKDNQPPNLMLLLSAIVGLAGLYMRMKWAIWVCIFMTMSGVLTSRRDTMDTRQMVMTGTMAVMGIITTYMAPPVPLPAAKATRT